MKKISYLLYRFLKFFDDLIFFIFKKKILIHFNDFFNQDFYDKVKINEKNTIFFSPNPVINWRVKSLYSKEPETLEWINSFDKNNNNIFWDIGANIGLYSIYAAQKHDNLKIISFEPSTSNLRVLSRNISINNLQDKITINQIPLNDKENIHVPMYEPEFIEGWAMNSYGSPTDYEGKNFQAKQKYNLFGTNINFLLDNNILKIPNYIKIDVDGIEDLVLRGAKNLLKDNNLKELSIEMNPTNLEQYKFINKFMEENSFKQMISTNSRLLNDKDYKLGLNEIVNVIFKRDN